MKICFVCNEYPPAPAGGIGTFTRTLAEALVCRGHEVCVAGHGTQDAEEFQAGVRVLRFPAGDGRLAPAVNRVRLHRLLRRIAADGRIDVLEAPDFEGPSAFVPRSARATVVRLHGSHRYFSDERGVAPSRSVSFLEKAALQQSDAIVSVSNYTARRTAELFELKCPITTVHNAVELDASLPRKQNYSASRRIVYFGTLAEKKGVLALAEAWRRFAPSHPGWRLELIGRDSRFAGGSVQQVAIEKMGSAAESAEFLGPMTHAELLLRLPDFDFAILPSYSEAFALAPMEAMALGLPVVFSSMSSGPELIEHGVDGWLCDPRDVDNVLSTMESAAADDGGRARIGAAARAKVETTFAYDAFVQRNIELYENLLQKKGVA